VYSFTRSRAARIGITVGFGAAIFGLGARLTGFFAAGLRLGVRDGRGLLTTRILPALARRRNP